MQFKISMSGSTMLLGEHAVLRGYPALVCAVDRFIKVSLEPRSDNQIFIDSSAFGCFSSDLDNLHICKPFQFVLAALIHIKSKLPSGFNLSIESEFSDKIGLGSSAAVTVATLVVVQKWIESALNLDRLYQDGVSVVRKIQGIGSGADIAASVFGGVICYQMDPLKIERIECNLPISLVYVGYKTPTVEVVKKVNVLQENQPERFEELFKGIGDCVERSCQAIKKLDWLKLGRIFLEHQKLQEALGVSDETISEVIYEACKLKTVLGAKISGSGLGDCVVVLGDLPKNYFPMNEQQKERGIRQIDVNVAKVKY